MNVPVAEVGGQVWQIALGIYSLAIPLRHAMNNKCMPQIMDPWSTAPRCLPQPRLLNHAAEQRLRHDVTVAAFLMPEER